MRLPATDPFEPKDHLGKYSRDRFGPRHPQLARFGLRVSLPVIERLFRQRRIHRFDGRFATERSRELIAKIGRGEKAYIAGIGIGEFHNTGVALIEVSPKTGMRIICNNEEERFTGRKHTNRHPTASPEELRDHMDYERIFLDEIVASQLRASARYWRNFPQACSFCALVPGRHLVWSSSWLESAPPWSCESDPNHYRLPQ